MRHAAAYQNMYGACAATPRPHKKFLQTCGHTPTISARVVSGVAGPRVADTSLRVQYGDHAECGFYRGSQMSKDNLRDQASHFEFGKNWLDYAKKIDEARIGQAVDDLTRLAGKHSFAGMRFFDIGCGSGLPALAACKCGASEVVGIDIDPDSVAASQRTFAEHAPAARATFSQASIFDISPASFGTFDIVYSWGVLHHTGDMKEAIRIAASFVRPGGLLLIALYRKTPFCGAWRIFKRWYASAGEAQQARAMRANIKFRRFWSELGGQDFDRYVREYGRLRGMDYYNDVHDWLGGYPYESISASACVKLVEPLGFSLQYQKLAHVGKLLPGFIASGCSEFAFRRAH